MKRIVFASMLALGVMLAAGGPADAQPCPAVCGVQKRTCVQTARVAALACKETCRADRAPTALGACMRGCSSAFRAAKGNCRAERRGCLDGCGTPPGGCVGICGKDLATCVRGVTGDARACLGGCRTADDRRACVAECTTGLRDGNAACRGEFQACKGGCAGSPSGAFAVE